jgi:excisionase family DNA binding protein
VERASPEAPTLDDWLTTEEVAKKYNVLPRVVLRMIREGRLAASKPEGGWQWLIHKSHLPEHWPPPAPDRHS